MDRQGVRDQPDAHIWVFHGLVKIIKIMKVMCLGDNSSHHAWAHHLTMKLAEENNSTFRGIVPTDLSTLQKGYYHIGPLDMSAKEIMDSTKNFDRVILLDQEQDKFSSHRIFL